MERDLDLGAERASKSLHCNYQIFIHRRDAVDEEEERGRETPTDRPTTLQNFCLSFYCKRRLCQAKLRSRFVLSAPSWRSRAGHHHHHPTCCCYDGELACLLACRARREELLLESIHPVNAWPSDDPSCLRSQRDDRLTLDRYIMKRRIECEMK